MPLQEGGGPFSLNQKRRAIYYLELRPEARMDLRRHSRQEGGGRLLFESTIGGLLFTAGGGRPR